MTRTPTTTDTTVEWKEKVTDPDSDQLTITLVLDAVDDGSGFTNDGTDSSNLSWLSFSKDKSTLNDGTTEVLVNIVADKSGLDQGYSYRFKITADDGTTAVDRTFTLSIESPPIWSGKELYINNQNNNDLKSYSLTNKWDLSSLGSLNKSFDYSGNSGGFNFGLYIRPDGKKAYTFDANNANLLEYDIGTAWNISTASFNQSASVSNGVGGVETEFHDLYFKPDGTKVFCADATDQAYAYVVTYELLTAWDINTTNRVDRIRIDNQFDEIDSPEGIYVRQDGNKMYIGGEISFNNKLFEYDLSTSFVPSTMQPVQNTSITGDISSSIWFKPDGKKLYWADQENGVIYEVGLQTAWDISTTNNEVSKNIPGSTGIVIGGG